MKGLKVGQISEVMSDLGTRDAFHVPGILVCASLDIEPGTHLLLQTCDRVVACTREERTGIADPFVPDTILAGQIFWLFLEPSLVSNLVHNFDVVGMRDIPEELNSDQPLPDDDEFYDDPDPDGCNTMGCD